MVKKLDVSLEISKSSVSRNQKEQSSLKEHIIQQDGEIARLRESLKKMDVEFRKEDTVHSSTIVAFT